MKQFFYKSGLLFIVFTMISFIVNLGFAMNNQQNKVPKIVPGLSENYKTIHVSNDEDIIGKLCNVSRQNGVYGVVLSEGYVGINDVSGLSDDFEICEGRGFEEIDRTNRTDTCLIEKKNLDLCEIVDGKRMYFYEDRFYEVIGIFESFDKTGANDMECIINIYSKSLINKNNIEWAFMDFKDAGMNNLVGIEGEMINPNDPGKGYFKNVIMPTSMVKWIMIILICTMCTHAFGAACTWNEGITRELAIRQVIGATTGSAYRFIIAHFSLKVIISAVIGGGAAELLLLSNKRIRFSQSLLNLFGYGISLRGLLISTAILFLIGFVIISISIISRKSVPLIQQIHKI